MTIRLVTNDWIGEQLFKISFSGINETNEAPCVYINKYYNAYVYIITRQSTHAHMYTHRLVLTNTHARTHARAHTQTHTRMHGHADVNADANAQGC
jgi:hypothetical protein